MIRTFFRHGCNAVLGLVLLVWLSASAAGWTVRPVLVLLGAVVFLSGEYGFHRFVLHAPLARDGTRVQRIQRRLHHDHHLAPGRLDRLFLPPWLLGTNLAVTGLVARLVWSRIEAVTSVVAGVAAATLLYEWTHYVAHTAYRPRTPWGRRLKRNHLWHHFRDDRSWFGVTHPALDVLMRTCPPGERRDGRPEWGRRLPR